MQSGGTTQVPSYSSMIRGPERGSAPSLPRPTTGVSTRPVAGPKYTPRRSSGPGREAGSKGAGSTMPAGRRDPTSRRFTISTGNSPENAWP